jgi:PadR family transcriptional regulator, regulatory protein PadR
VKQSQFLKGALDVAVLAAVQGGETYGYKAVRLLNEAGMESVAEASVYGTLRRLEAEGLLTSRLVASKEGPARRYYVTTESGLAALSEWHAALRGVTVAVERLIANSVRKGTNDG